MDSQGGGGEGAGYYYFYGLEKKSGELPLFPIDYCRFLKSLLSHSKYFVKEETTLGGYKVKNKILIPQITNAFFGEKVLMERVNGVLS